CPPTCCRPSAITLVLTPMSVLIVSAVSSSTPTGQVAAAIRLLPLTTCKLYRSYQGRACPGLFISRSFDPPRDDWVSPCCFERILDCIEASCSRKFIFRSASTPILVP